MTFNPEQNYDSDSRHIWQHVRRFSRREFLRVGGAGILGVSLADVLRLQASAASAPGQRQRQIGLNSRARRGRVGFGPDNPMCSGPWRKTRMTDLAGPRPICLWRCRARRRRWLASAERRQADAEDARAPTRRNSRRLKPSHVLPDSPGIEIIILLRCKTSFRCVHVLSDIREWKGEGAQTGLRNDKGNDCQRKP